MSTLERTSKLILSSLMACTLLVACDKSDDKADKKAEEKELTADEKAVQERLEKKRAERAAKEEAAKKEAEAVKALAALPEEMPKDLEAACAAAAEAEDAFMNRMFEGNAVEQWNAAKDTQLGMRKANCTKQGNIEIPACQAKAMGDAPEEFAKKLPDILAACIEKYGEDAAAEGGDAPAPD